MRELPARHCPQKTGEDLGAGTAVPKDQTRREALGGGQTRPGRRAPAESARRGQVGRTGREGSAAARGAGLEGLGEGLRGGRRAGAGGGGAPGPGPRRLPRGSAGAAVARPEGGRLSGTGTSEPGAGARAPSQLS